MAEEAKATEKPPVSEEEMRAIFSGPAVAANKIYVTVSPAGVRVTFCEQWSQEAAPTFRAAALLSFPDAIALKDLLTRQLENVTVEVRQTDSQKDG